MEMNIYQKLQHVRVEVQKKASKKSGKNKFAGFEYYELKDFLPIANEEMAKVGCCSTFHITGEVDETGLYREIAVLNFSDGDKTIHFEIPTADASVKGATPIQSLGAKITYCERYLMMIMLQLSEYDVVDATSGKEEPKTQQEAIRKPTAKQMELLEQLYTKQEIAKILADRGLKEVDMVLASKMIKFKQGGQNGNN